MQSMETDNIWDNVWNGLVKKIQKLDSVAWEKQELSKNENGNTLKIRRYAAIIDKDGYFALKVELEKECVMNHYNRVDPAVNEEEVEYHVRIYEVNMTTKYEKILRTYRRTDAIGIFKEIERKINGKLLDMDDKKESEIKSEVNESRDRLLNALAKNQDFR